MRSLALMLGIINLSMAGLNLACYFWAGYWWSLATAIFVGGVGLWFLNKARGD